MAKKKLKENLISTISPREEAISHFKYFNTFDRRERGGSVGVGVAR